MRLDFFYGQFRSSHKTRISTGPVSGEQITWPSTATGAPLEHRRLEGRGTSLPLLALAWYAAKRCLFRLQLSWTYLVKEHPCGIDFCLRFRHHGDASYGRKTRESGELC